MANRKPGLLVVGSIALDTVETPLGRREAVLGGSATYFAYAASFFTPVRLVGVVGEDFPDFGRRVLGERPIDLRGLVTRPGKTFRWSGRYDQSMNDRETVAVELNVFGEYRPEVPAAFRGTEHVFLANGPPAVQLAVLDQMTAPRMVVTDTMNLWITTTRDELLTLLKRTTGLVLNDSEARLLTGQSDLVTAAMEVLALGPRFVIIKKGEHGALVVDQYGLGALPAFPVRDLTDPTGAGDCFAGGFMGYLTRVNDLAALRSAVAYGVVVASFAVEAFSLDRLRGLKEEDIQERMSAYRKMLAV